MTIDSRMMRMMRMVRMLKMLRVMIRIMMRGRLGLHEESAKEGARAFPDPKEETPHQTHHLDCNDDDDKK